MDWYIWRIRMSDKLGHPSFTELEDEWCFTDLLDAHALLDAFDEAQSQANA